MIIKNKGFIGVLCIVLIVMLTACGPQRDVEPGPASEGVSAETPGTSPSDDTEAPKPAELTI